MSEVSLRELSDAAQSGVWHTVDAPWGSGDWIVAGNPDPHAGLFVCIFDGAVIGYEATDAYHADPAENAAFVASLVNAFRAGCLHDDTALAEAEARGRRAALEEADNREVERILSLTDAEIIAEIEAEGHDPDTLAEAMRGQMNATFRLCEEIKTLREALAPFAAILAEGEPVGPIPRGLLDSKITRQDLRRATAALANTTPETRQPETAWQDISTAPKDGRGVIVAVPSLNAGEPMIVGEAYFSPAEVDGGWWWAGTSAHDYFTSPMDQTNALPVLWQPLPAVPEPPARIANLDREDER